MDGLREFLQAEFNKINAEFNKIHDRLDRVEREIKHDITVVYARLDRIDARLDNIEHEINDVKRVVRQSAEDILENQVEEIARHNLHEEKIRALEAKTFRLDKSFLELKQRVEKLEKTNL